MSTASVVRFEHVSVEFDGDLALNDVSFDVRAGETRVILGAAGSGKTVLLKVAMGLVRPSAGRVFLFDTNITHLRERDLFSLRSRVGILFQEGGLFDSLTIEENVAYPLVNQASIKCPAEEVLPRVNQALQFVELGHTLAKVPSELSGGMRRRVGIARAGVTEPPLVLYDSPTAGLDPITANTIMALVVKQRDLRNITPIIVTHRAQDGYLLANYCWNTAESKVERATAGHRATEQTEYMVMCEGKLVFQGPEEALSASSDPYVSKFVRRNH
ncbi:MAG: ATP-binding cassette domain-containing protein [Acidobacteria bacterium]|nr:ATP-binding cassette domain-containing protein [Acidobacteriota bacterium]